MTEPRCVLGVRRSSKVDNGLSRWYRSCMHVLHAQAGGPVPARGASGVVSRSTSGHQSVPARGAACIDALSVPADSHFCLARIAAVSQVHTDSDPCTWRTTPSSSALRTLRVCIESGGCRCLDRRWLQREHARQPLRPEQPSVRTNVGLNCRTHAQKDGRWLTSEEPKVSRASNMCLRACIVTIITVQTGWREEEDASPGSLGERKEDGAPEIND